MKYLSGQANYDKFPNVEVKGYEHAAVRSWEHIVDTIEQRIQGQDKHILVTGSLHSIWLLPIPAKSPLFEYFPSV